MKSRFRRVLPEIDRYSDDIDAFAKKDAVTRYAEDLVVFTGSSSINLWSTLEQDMAPYPVINRGFGGSTLREVNHYFHEVVGKYKPAQVFLYCGENDIAEKASVDETFQSFLTFVSLCEKHLPQTEIVYLSVKPSPTNWSLRRKFQALNHRISAHYETAPNLHYLDVASVMLKEDGKPDESLFIEDQLHINELGYERWTKVIKPVLEELRK